MEFEDELEICCEEMSKDYGISEKTAYRIILDLDIEDTVIKYYSEAIEEAEREQRETWQKEIDDNPDLYRDDIHGGV